MTEVAVIAYGAGNVASVQFALERLGATVRLTDDPSVIAEAERVILPGVGDVGRVAGQAHGGAQALQRELDRGDIAGTVGENGDGGHNHSSPEAKRQGEE